MAAPTSLIVVTKSFSPSTISPGGVSVMTITVYNGGVGITASFTDTYPAGLVNAPAPNATNSGSGTFSGVAGAGSCSVSGATMSFGQTDTYTIRVTSATGGNYQNSLTATDGLTSSAAATATLVVSRPTGTSYGGALPPHVHFPRSPIGCPDEVEAYNRVWVFWEVRDGKCFYKRKPKT